MSKEEGTKPSTSIWNKIEPHEDAEYYNRKFNSSSLAATKEIRLMREHASKAGIKW